MSFVAARLATEAPFSVPENTFVRIPVMRVFFDHGGAAGFGDLVAPEAGVYLVVASAIFDTSALGMRALALKRIRGDVSEFIGNGHKNASPAPERTAVSATTLIDLEAGDIIEAWVRQVGQPSLDVVVQDNRSAYLAFAKIG